MKWWDAGETIGLATVTGLAFPRRERRVVFHSACGLREVSGAMGAGLGMMPVLS